MLRCLFFLAILFGGTLAHAFPAYYDFNQQAEAKKEAADRNLPLAWMGGRPADLTDATPPSVSNLEFEKMVIATLKDRAVIIFFDGLSQTMLPTLVNTELHVKDDGELPDGHTWRGPKVIFTNAAVTEAIGRASRSQMEQSGEGALISVLQIMRNKERSAQAKAAASDPATTVAPVKAGKESEVVGGISNAVDFIDLVAQYRMAILAVGVVAAGAFAGFVWWVKKK